MKELQIVGGPNRKIFRLAFELTDTLDFLVVDEYNSCFTAFIKIKDFIDGSGQFFKANATVKGANIGSMSRAARRIIDRDFILEYSCNTARGKLIPVGDFDDEDDY